MRKLLLIITVVMSIGLSAQQTTFSPVTEDLSEHLIQNPEEQLIRINIRLKEKIDARKIIPGIATLNYSARREAVKSYLKKASIKSQKNLVTYLNTKQSRVTVIHKFWITNVITCLASAEVINELSLRDDIALIDIDKESYVLIGKEDERFEPQDLTRETLEITYNVSKINAPGVWDLGFTGEGIIVAVIDTGVNYNHDDLEDHMWEDPDYPNHGYDFNGNDNDPMDDHGHGTHCSGTVAGDGTSGSQTGVAPDATIMALKVLNSGGGGQQSNSWQAIEFAVEHGAHILSMSIGWSPGSNPDRPAWRNAHDNAYAAGVIASVAAGNEGGSPNSLGDLRTPGDCPPPWLHPDQTLEGGLSSVVCIGATDQNDNIASFSSRGPAGWEFINPFNDYPFNPEMGLLRPDISAPGVNVKSCDAFNPTGYTTMSGTSMATPGVAGAMALILSKNPELTIAQLDSILEITSLDLGTTGKDNVYGTGRIDVLEAINHTPLLGNIVYFSHTINDPNENGEVEAGESIQLSIEMLNQSQQTYADVDVTISTTSQYVTITDDNEPYGNMNPNATKTVENGFSFDVLEGTPGNREIPFTVVAESNPSFWQSNFTITTYGPNMRFGNLLVDDSDSGNGDGILDPGETAILIIEVSNDGQASVSNVEIDLAVNDEIVTIENPSQIIYSFNSGDSQTLNFIVEVSSDAQAGTFIEFDFNMQSGSFSDSRKYHFGISLFIEDWETDSFKKFNWMKSGSPMFSNWETTNLNPYEGRYAAKTGGLSNNEYLTLKLTGEVVVDDNISFYYFVSSEEDKDFLKFYIDDDLMGQWSGEQSWTKMSYPVTGGNHTFKWEYRKDDEKSEGADIAMLDFIVLPQLSMPTADAGTDAGICDSETYTLSGSTENSIGVEWTTNGDGAFSDVSILNPVYTPGTEDIANTEVRLTLFAEGYNGSVSSGMDLFFISAPAKLDTPEGETEFCQNPGISTYSATYIPESTYVWEIDPATAGTTGSISDTAVVVWNPDFSGTATIKARSSNSCGNSEFSDPLEVIISAYPDVNLGDDQTLCGEDEFELNAGNPGATYLWSTDETTQKIMATGDGEDTFWVKVTNASSCAASDTIMLKFAALPTVNLGVDTAICRVSEVILDAGNQGSEYLWSTGETTQEIVVKGDDYEHGFQEFSCKVTNTDGCENTGRISVEIKDCTGIDEFATAVSLEVYPNPNRGSFILKLESPNKEEVTIRVMTVTGVVVYNSRQVVNGSNTFQIDLEGQAEGVYSVFITGEKILLNRKIVVRK